MTEQLDVKELFRKEIAKWKEEDPLFMAYVYGYEAGKKDGREKLLDEVIEKWREWHHAGYERPIQRETVVKLFEELRQKNSEHYPRTEWCKNTYCPECPDSDTCFESRK